MAGFSALYFSQSLFEPVHLVANHLFGEYLRRRWSIMFGVGGALLLLPSIVLELMLQWRVCRVWLSWNCVIRKRKCIDCWSLEQWLGMME
jgi:hypothetical protein